MILDILKFLYLKIVKYYALNAENGLATKNGMKQMFIVLIVVNTQRLDVQNVAKHLTTYIVKSLKQENRWTVQ